METIAEGLDTPWSVAELLTRVSGNRASWKHQARGTPGEITAVTGVPEVFAKRQGGLFDAVLHPNFATNNTVFSLMPQVQKTVIKRP